MRYKINFGVGSVMRSIHIYLEMSKVYPKKCKVFSMRLAIKKRACSDFEVNTILTLVWKLLCVSKLV